MIEDRLPPAVLAKATLADNEYAWPLADVEEAVDAAEACGLACLGGQAQFRLPDGIAELYWIDADADDRLPDEPWPDFVKRSADAVRSRFRSRMASTDFDAEVSRWTYLDRQRAAGVPVMRHLCFVLYFNDEPTWSEMRLLWRSTQPPHRP